MTFRLPAILLACAAGALLAYADDKPAATTAPSTAPATPATNLAGEWKIAKDGTIEQSGEDQPALLLFGDKSWKNYTLELEAQKTGGAEGFLIAVRAKDADNLVWFNVGGWGNTRTAFEGILDSTKSDFGESQTYGDFHEVQDQKWHKLKITVAGTRIEGFLDGKSACKANASEFPEAGAVAIGTWGTQARFRNIKVTSPEGKTLWEGTLRIPK